MRKGNRHPDFICFQRIRYRIDFRYKNVLKVTQLLSDNLISKGHKENIALRLLLRFPSYIKAKLFRAEKTALLNALLNILCGNGENERQTVSINDDSDLIYAAFIQAYGIDLYRCDIDWRDFTALLSAVPEYTQLYKVMAVRSAEIPPLNENNREYVNSLIQLKRAYALKQNNSFEDGLNNVFNSVVHKQKG